MGDSIHYRHDFWAMDDQWFASKSDRDMALKAGLPCTNTCKSRYQSGTIEFDIVCVVYEGTIGKLTLNNHTYCMRRWGG
jgi:hypothetical protein